jgi:hypothetical protein
MYTGRTTVPALAVCAAMFWASGCGADRTAGPPPASTADALKEIAKVYEYLAHERQPPPSGLKDLEEYRDPALLNSWSKLESGEIVLVWRAGYAKAGAAAKKVLAYEKEAPTKGGAVLMQDGTVKEMTAAEFNAAPKAGR